MTRPDGTNITLGQIATVRDAFQEGFLKARFNGKPAVSGAHPANPDLDALSLPKADRPLDAVALAAIWTAAALPQLP